MLQLHVTIIAHSYHMTFTDLLPECNNQHVLRNSRRYNYRGNFHGSYQIEEWYWDARQADW